MERSREYLIALAKRYYVDEVSQQQIANELGISRPTVSTLLKRCKETGIVTIRIEESCAQTAVLEERIRSEYQLEDVIVVPATDADESLLLNRVGGRAAQYLSEQILPGSNIGIAWGTTLYQMVHQMPVIQSQEVSVVQLMGGFGAANPQYDGSELARELSRRLHAAFYPLQCPVLVGNLELKELLESEHGIRETLEMTRSLDMALVGLSSNDPESSALVRSGFLSYQEARQIQNSGAVGHICGYSYDTSGALLDISANRRIIGIRFEDLLSVPSRIAAACGIAKAQAVRAALEGKLVTTLIIDELLASRLI